MENMTSSNEHDWIPLLWTYSNACWNYSIVSRLSSINAIKLHSRNIIGVSPKCFGDIPRHFRFRNKNALETDQRELWNESGRVLYDHLSFRICNLCGTRYSDEVFGNGNRYSRSIFLPYSLWPTERDLHTILIHSMFSWEFYLFWFLIKSAMSYPITGFIIKTITKIRVRRGRDNIPTPRCSDT